MSDGVLQEVLRLEQAIAAELAEERRQAEAWLDAKRQEVQHQLQLQRDASQSAGLDESRRRELRRQAAVTLHRGCERLRRLQRLDDAALRQVLREVLAPVFGEGAHDRPDGQG